MLFDIKELLCEFASAVLFDVRDELLCTFAPATTFGVSGTAGLMVSEVSDEGDTREDRKFARDERVWPAGAFEEGALPPAAPVAVPGAGVLPELGTVEIDPSGTVDCDVP